MFSGFPKLGDNVAVARATDREPTFVAVSVGGEVEAELFALVATNVSIADCT